MRILWGGSLAAAVLFEVIRAISDWSSLNSVWMLALSVALLVVFHAPAMTFWRSSYNWIMASGT